MTRSMVVELWSRTAGVVGIYRVSQRRSFADLCVGRWRVDAVEVAEIIGRAIMHVRKP